MSSDEESSDSSDDFLVPAEQIDFDSSFFKTSINKTNPVSTSVIQPSSDDSDDDLEDPNDNVSSAELLAQVLRNFENAKAQSFIPNDNQPGISTEQLASVTAGDDLSKEINDLLLQGESQAMLTKKRSDNEVECRDANTEVKSDYTIPEKGIQIHLPGENLMFDRKKKRQKDFLKLLQSKINQTIRTTQVFVHKVGLLTWLAHGFFLNRLANDPELLAITLSLISPNNYPNGRADLKYIEQFTKWFSGRFVICEKHKEVTFNKDSLLQRVSEQKIYNYVELVLLYIATIRGMGIYCRLVISLQPPRLKPKPDELLKIPDNDTKSKSGTNKTDKLRHTDSKSTSSKSTRKCKLIAEEKTASPTKIIPENSQKIVKLQAKNRAAVILKKSKLANEPKKDHIETKRSSIPDDTKNLSLAEKLSLKVFKRNETKKKISSNNKQDVDETDKPNKEASKHPGSDSDLSDDEIEFSTDDDYVEKKPKKRTLVPVQKNQPTTSKATTKKYNHRKLLSSDEDDVSTNKNSYNLWVEVYLESEESWISVDVVDKKIHCSLELHKKAGDPVLYIVAWNSVGTLKDVTRRYCPHWLTDTRKKRVDEKWWKETLSNWKEKRTAISKAEDEQLLQRELEQPLPKTIGECKGHPLYVLTRHLLKFEALYPHDAIPLGYLKTGEAIYSRHCVHTLYSRETWIKKAKVVKLGEQAYKIVKSMPKYDKLSGQRIKDQPLELFGKWQTSHYVPPEAKDGKVPRNEYGNVDLFKMCMLPKGTAYIDLPGLNRVARKLNIDCAQACVGFNFGCRGALPAFEGYVVCEEYEDTLREAWEEEQIEARKRAKEKREKRIYGNWKKLIKGLIIREKLAAKYNFQNEVDNTSCEDKKQTKKPISGKQLIEAVMKNGESHGDNNIKVERSTNKDRVAKKKQLPDKECEEKEKMNNEKVEAVRKNFCRKTSHKIAQVASNDNAIETASGNGIKSDESIPRNDDGIQVTKKRATTSKQSVGVNVNEEEAKDKRENKTVVVPKKRRKIVKIASNDDASEMACSSGVKNDQSKFQNDNQIRTTRKRAAAVRNLVDVNVNEEESKDKRANKTVVVPKRRQQIVKIKPNVGAKEKAGGSGVKNDELKFQNDDRIRTTRKRAAAVKNLVDVNVNEEEPNDESENRTAAISKRKSSEKNLGIAAKISKRIKFEQDISSKKVKR